MGGQVVSGAYDGDAGELVPDPQLAVFEAVHGRADGGLDHLALHDTIVKDTRIEPLGFQPDEDTAPVGITFLRDADGGALGGGGVDLPGAASPPTLARGRPRWRPASSTRPRPATTSRPWPPPTSPTARARQLHSIWESTGRAAPVLMTTAQVTAQLTTEPPGVSGGCGCRTTTGSATVLPALALLLAWATRRRRAV